MIKIDEIKKYISDDFNSEVKRKARKAVGYYEGKHDIQRMRLFYYNADGELVEDTTRSNIKISHPFFTELVDQQVQYMLSGDSFIKSDDQDLNKELTDYFGDEFKSELAELLTHTIVSGSSYFYAYKNSKDRLSFQACDSLGVVEVRPEYTSDGVECVIYHVLDRIDKNGKKIKKIIVSDNVKSYFYRQVDDGQITLDDTVNPNPRPLYMYKKSGDDGLYFRPLKDTPFYRLDNNKKRISGLAPIKDLIDDYDLIACGLSNNIEDFDRPILAVTGYDGTDLGELQQNLKTTKVVGVGEGGGIQTQTVNIPYEARKIKLEMDEANIYRFGMGFNSNQVGDGNITNIVIKNRYALLDLKCNKLEIRLKAFLRKIIGLVLDEINEKNGTAYNSNDVSISFVREIMTNASDNANIEKTEAERKQVEINTILALANVLDNETVIKMICDVLDIDFDEVKSKLPVDELEDNDKAVDLLGELNE